MAVTACANLTPAPPQTQVKTDARTEIKAAFFEEFAPTKEYPWVMDDAAVDEIASVRDIRRFKVIKRSHYNPRRDKDAFSVEISVREAGASHATCVCSANGGGLAYNKSAYQLVKKGGQWKVVSSNVEEMG